MLGTTASILLAGGAFAATTAIGAGNAQAKATQNKAAYDAQVYEQQAEMIGEKKKIQNTQYLRQAAVARSSIIARTAGKGFNMGGSPLAILIDNESQMQFDKAISDYNLDVERNYAQSGATQTRLQGDYTARAQRYSGYSDAFSIAMNTGGQLAGAGAFAPANTGYGKSGLTKSQRMSQMNTFKAGRYGRA